MDPPAGLPASARLPITPLPLLTTKKRIFDTLETSHFPHLLLTAYDIANLRCSFQQGQHEAELHSVLGAPQKVLGDIPHINQPPTPRTTSAYGLPPHWSPFNNVSLCSMPGQRRLIWPLWPQAKQTGPFLSSAVARWRPGEWCRQPFLSSAEHLDMVLPRAFARGLSNASLPGRAQKVHDKLENADVLSQSDEPPVGVRFSKALFVPSMSSYHKVDSAMSAVPTDITKDVSWQFALRRTWDKMIHGKDAILDDDRFQENLVNLPSYGFLYEDPFKKCNPEGERLSCSAVIPSLPMTLRWLRDCVKENPSICLQVLVTGSLHLVGDLLKLVRR
ncbi:hypothetical protein Taro_021624 [Colocasia esculenta]|uniref:Uncharacterized protein n=1 Tax=Colocasia esculenta TaxID=4460 RepID=A0A843V1Q5_COLES|nr:hypothetical protein [Colocasia esculenta]